MPPALKILTFLLLPLTTLPACGLVNEVLTNPEKPTASIQSLRLKNLSLTAADLEFDVAVNNPYSVALPLTNIQYALASDGDPFLTGTAPTQGLIPPQNAKTIKVPARVSFPSLLATLKSIKPGAVIPYNADLKLTVDAPIIGPLSLPLSKTGQLPIPTAPKVKLTGIKWNKLSLNEASATLNLNISNTNQFPLDLRTLAYKLTLGGSEIINTTTNQPTQFKKSADTTLQLPISIKPTNLGLAVFNILSQKQASYTLTGSIQSKTPFGPLNLPFSRSGRTSFTKNPS